MTITVEVDFCKENISDFGELAKSAFQYALEFGREMVRRIVEERDAELRKERDTARYVNKGKRKTCLKTMLGNIEFERTVYIDKTPSQQSSALRKRSSSAFAAVSFIRSTSSPTTDIATRPETS